MARKSKNDVSNASFRWTTLAVLCVFGIMDVIFENTIFNLFKNLTKPYLEKAYEESKKLFITLSLLKGTADVIEGSTVNVNMILGMNVEIGDIVKPIYITRLNLNKLFC